MRTRCPPRRARSFERGTLAQQIRHRGAAAAAPGRSHPLHPRSPAGAARRRRHAGLRAARARAPAPRRRVAHNHQHGRAARRGPSAHGDSRARPTRWLARAPRASQCARSRRRRRASVPHGARGTYWGPWRGARCYSSVCRCWARRWSCSRCTRLRRAPLRRARPRRLAAPHPQPPASRPRRARARRAGRWLPRPSLPGPTRLRPPRKRPSRSLRASPRQWLRWQTAATVRRWSPTAASRARDRSSPSTR